MADKDALPLVEKLIKQRTKHWSPSMVTAPIQEGLLKLIAQKKTLKPAKKTARGQKEDAGPTSNVINIMDALRKSTEADLKSRKSG